VQVPYPTPTRHVATPSRLGDDAARGSMGPMQIRVGYELLYEFAHETAVIATLNVHYTRSSDLVRPDVMIVSPSVPITAYRDTFGNWCSRMVVPQGKVRIAADGLVTDAGLLDPFMPGAEQYRVEALPEDALIFLLGSRYCETDRMTEIAWGRFAQSPPGWGRVQAICDFVHEHITFGYEHARVTKTAWEAFHERKGVCRDFAHLAVTLCRCMNIPARYCTGYLSDVGVPPPHAPMDFAAWFEAYIGGCWYTFDPRNNARRAGRVLIARGRDAADVAIATTFGPNKLEKFTVWTDEVGA